MMECKMMEFFNLKEMVYDGRRDSEIIADGVYDGFYFAIISRGTHPCAYIEIDEDHPYYKKIIDDVDLPVHCGVTFTGCLSSTSGKLKKFENRFFIGWDYAHYGDHIEGIFNGFDDKKWTVAEIFEEDVIPAIHFLKEISEA